MTKIHFAIILLGSFLFLWDTSYGVGWIFGWFFVGLLRQYREDILERVIDFEHFSTKRYIVYLLLVILWITIPLVISFLFPQFINPLAVFGAFFTDRMLMFILESLGKKEAR